jgi:uncharacterized OsmC-like protein
VLAVAADVPEARAVATIGAPADVSHVLGNFGASLQRIEEDGEADVTLAGRTFRITKQFVDDVCDTRLAGRIAEMKKPLLILHSPIDQVVGIDNAAQIYMAARHPKSFISLDHADHLLERPEDASFAAMMIASWSSRYLPADEPQGERERESVEVSETGEGTFQNTVRAGRHRIFADEPVSVGGLDSGPSPYDFLSAALGACTSMTLRMYARHKNLDLGKVTVEVSHDKIHASDCEDCTQEQRGRGGKIDRFDRVITFESELRPDLHDKIIEIAGKCPVHRTLESGSSVTTHIASVPDRTGDQAD